MADVKQAPTVMRPADACGPTELGAGELDGVTGGGEDTVIYQFDAIAIAYAVDPGAPASRDPSTKGTIPSKGR